MSNSLGKNFTFGTLLKFAFPNIVMMLVLSLYTVVDGTFVSRYAGTTALSSINMFYPAIGFMLGLGIMVSSGGSAVIAAKMGEGDNDGARQSFTLLVITEAVMGLLVLILGTVFTDEIIHFLGASKAQFQMSRDYGKIYFIFAPAFFLQTGYQMFFVTAGRPGLGLFVSVLSGLINVLFDYIFIAVFEMGVTGAAIATGMGCFFSAIFGTIYFFIRKNKILYFVKTKFNGSMLAGVCLNGSSEMVTNLSNSITTFLFNYMFLKYYGEDGVAAMTIVMYFEFLFTAVFFGYSNGVSPVISFKYGADDRKQIKALLRHCMVFVIICSVSACAVSQGIIGNIVTIFTEKGSNVYNISTSGFHIYSIGFLFMGVNILSSAFFTALSNGKASAAISFARTFIFLSGSIIVLPMVFGKEALWAALPCAEVLGIIVSVIFLAKNKERYKK